jgi:hypothetical protein
VRLKSEMWVKAYLRRAAVGGCPGAVVRHGDDDAGAIFIKIDTLDGYGKLFGPASAGYDDNDLERRFIQLTKLKKAELAAIDALMAREISFDPDLWLVEIESRAGAEFLEGWLIGHT